MSKIIINRKFAEELAQLSRPIQRSVTGIYSKLAKQADGNGLNLEPVLGSGDPKIKSVRVNDNYRIILHRDGKGTFTFLHIDKHDDAYRWAARNRFEVNAFTGEVQLYVVDIPEVHCERAPAPIAGPVQTVGPFSQEPSNEDLLRLGIPEGQIPFVRQLKDDEDILQHESDFSQGVFDVLLSLYDGKTPDEIVKDLGLKKDETVSTEDIATAVEKNDSSQSQFVFASDEAELNRIREAAELGKWRIFLHPSQARIVRKKTNGPMKVLGGAGTGKTVVAMHRARYLLEHVFIKKEQKILFTTFTKNLCDDIQDLLATICSEEEMARVDIRNLDAWAAEYVRSQKIEVNPLYEEHKRKELMQRAIDEVAPENEWTKEFYLRERANVVLANEIASFPAYLRVSRAGAGVRLSAGQKKDVWAVLEAYRRMLNEGGYVDPDEVVILAHNLLEKNQDFRPYVSVIVDEAQDFSAPALKLIARLSGNTRDAPQPDSLLIVGDAHQRIYKRKATLGKCGINVTGRSSKLRLNYRTTDKIRRRAVALLQGVAVDDLDGQKDDNKGFHSLVVGLPPAEARFKTFEKEMDGIAEKIRMWHDQDNRPFSNYAVLVRTDADVKAIADALEQRGLKTKKISRTVSAKSVEDDFVRVATMHRSKGLEFAGVVVAEINQGKWPLRPGEYAEMDAISQKESDDAERSLLYVALTRAMKHAMLVGVGDAPAEL